MAIINGSNGAIYLQPGTGTQLLEGNINGCAALGNGDYFAVYGPGPYAFSIIVTGDVQSGGASSLDGGIVLGGPGIIDNQGTIAGGAGILVNGYAYGGSTYLKNSGLIEGRVGAAVYTYGQAGVNNSGRIIGGSNGVYISGGGVVTNAGSVSGGTGVAVATYYGRGYVANAGIITGTSTDGVFAVGTVVNDPSGTIAGAEVGVNLYGGGSLSNARGVISGGAVGAAIYGYGNGYGDAPAAIKNSGSISGGAAGIGIELSHTLASNIYNQSGGVISGGSYGIVEYNPAPIGYGDPVSDVTIGNAGTIAAGGSAAAPAGAASAAYSYGPPGAQGAGIALDYGHIVNTGTVSGYTGVFGYGYVSLYNSGRIAGAAAGAVFSGLDLVTNRGAITGGTVGIDISTLNSLSYILNGSGGVITGGSYGIADYPAGSQFRYQSIGNAGYIEGGGSNTSRSNGNSGYYANSGIVVGEARIVNTGTIKGGATGIFANYVTYIYNSNRVAGGNTGIDLGGPGTVVNHGLIGGGTYAIRANFGSTITNAKGGDIAGGAGIGFAGQGLLSNAGDVTATSGAAVTGDYGVIIFNTGLIAGGLDAGAISFSGDAAVYNYAGIAGGVTLGGGYLYNTGTIAGGAQTGVALTASGYIINYTGGSITGAVGVKLVKDTSFYNYGAVGGGVTATGSAAVYNYVGATISGAVDGVFLAAGNVSDYGVISGGQYAVAFGTHGVNLLEIAPTATLIGGAYLGGGGIALLDGAAAGTLTAASYKDFAAVTLAAGADWDILGSIAAGELVAFAGGGTIGLETPSGFAGTLENFAAGETIDLTGITLSSITATHFAGGVLTLTENSGSLTLTFANPGSFGSETFALFADGAGTGITLAPAVTLAAQKAAGWIGNDFVQTPASAISLVTLQA